MKLPFLVIFPLAIASAALAADSKPLLRGLIETNSTQRFLLSSEGGTQEKWVGIGDTYGGWKVDSWSGDQKGLTLKGPQGEVVVLSMQRSATGAASAEPENATLAQAQLVINRMHIAEMMRKMLDQQKRAMAGMTRQMMAKMKPDANPADVDRAVAMQQKVMSAVFSSIDLNDLQNQMAQAYSTIFTPDELQGMADFYDTPAGQAAIQKQPQVQQAMMQIMMPKIMGAVQQMQQHMGAGGGGTGGD